MACTQWYVPWRQVVNLSLWMHSCKIATAYYLLRLITVYVDRYTVADPGDDPQINASVTATVTSVGISSSSASGPAASTTSGLSSPSKPANTTLYIVIGAGIGGAGLIGAVILIYRRRQRRRQSAVPEESPPFMASSFRSPTPVTGGIFTKATSIDASNGHFSDVQGDQSNMRIHTINYNFIGASGYQ